MFHQCPILDRIPNILAVAHITDLSSIRRNPTHFCRELGHEQPFWKMAPRNLHDKPCHMNDKLHRIDYEGFFRRKLLSILWEM